MSELDLSVGTAEDKADMLLLRVVYFFAYHSEGITFWLKVWCAICVSLTAVFIGFCFITTKVMQDRYEKMKYYKDLGDYHIEKLSAGK